MFWVAFSCGEGLCVPFLQPYIHIHTTLAMDLCHEHPLPVSLPARRHYYFWTFHDIHHFRGGIIIAGSFTRRSSRLPWELRLPGFVKALGWDRNPLPRSNAKPAFHTHRAGASAKMCLALHCRTCCFFFSLNIPGAI